MNIAAEAAFVVAYLQATTDEGRCAVLLSLPIVMAAGTSEAFVGTLAALGTVSDDMERARPGYRQMPQYTLVATAIDALATRSEAVANMHNDLHTLLG
jgi:hypothetical protein